MQNWWPLPASQYDPDLGWVCPVLDQDGAELVEFRMRGQTIPIDQFKVSPPYIRFVNFPEGGIADAKAAVLLKKKRSTTFDTAIVVAVIGLLGVLFTAIVNYLNAHPSSPQSPPSEKTAPSAPEVPARAAQVEPSMEEPRGSGPMKSKRPNERPESEGSIPERQDRQKHSTGGIPSAQMRSDDSSHFGDSVKRMTEKLNNNEPAAIRENIAGIFDFQQCAKPEWPEDARVALNAGFTAETTLMVTIGVDGWVKSVGNMQSSGSSSLDEAAARSIMRCKGQVRGELRNGEAVEYVRTMKYRWTLG